LDWNEVSPPDLGGPIAFIAPLVLSSGSPQTLYGGSSYLFKSTDFGDQWTVEGGGNPIDGNAILTIAVSPNDDDVVYLATFPDADRGRVHVTTNGGTTFTDITGTLPDRYPGDLAIDPTDDATVYITMSGFGTSHVFKSTNFGSTWIDLDGGQLPDVPTLAVTVDPMFPEHVYVGNDIGVYLTADDGVNWAQLPQGLPQVVLTTDLSISSVDRKLRVASHGNGAYQMDLLGTVVSAEPPLLAARVDLTLHPSAPNPFSTSTLIRFDLPREGQVELTVYDVRGAKVRGLLDERRTAGTHRTSWDGRDDRGRRVAAGAYFYRLRAGDASATGQVVLTK
jgi:photosystem II stability/assembly factor-like uncharacterized protein